MRKLLSSLFTVIILFFANSSDVLASSDILIAREANFQNPATEFAGGDEIFVQVRSDSSGDKRSLLNLRDNEYNLIQSFSLQKSTDNTFETSLSAPVTEGYYSLEAIVEAQGSKSTSVKTIKVGKSNQANIKIDVDSSLSEQSKNNAASINNSANSNSSSNSNDFVSVLDNQDVGFEEVQTNEESGFIEGILERLREFLSEIF